MSYLLEESKIYFLLYVASPQPEDQTFWKPPWSPLQKKKKK